MINDKWWLKLYSFATGWAWGEHPGLLGEGKSSQDRSFPGRQGAFTGSLLHHFHFCVTSTFIFVSLSLLYNFHFHVCITFTFTFAFVSQADRELSQVIIMIMVVEKMMMTLMMVMMIGRKKLIISFPSSSTFNYCVSLWHRFHFCITFTCV